MFSAGIAKDFAAPQNDVVVLESSSLAEFVVF
jgi:hypothetical protein